MLVDVDFLALLAVLGDDLGRLQAPDDRARRRQRRAIFDFARQEFIMAGILLIGHIAGAIGLHRKGMPGLKN